MAEMGIMDSRSWKCTEANNGYIKPKTQAEESLLSSSAVTTVVQVSGARTKTLVSPEHKCWLTKEKCLIALVVALVIVFCLVLVLSLLSVKSSKCKETREKVCLTEECVRTVSDDDAQVSVNLIASSDEEDDEDSEDL